MSTITKFQSDFGVIDRTSIKNAPYNPRFISSEALKRIKGNIKSRKLMGGIVVNKRTMNLVSGHQRLACVDSLEKKQDYKIRVEWADLTDKEEKEQNIFMNSATAQGEFNFEMLQELLPEIDYIAAGLDETDLNIIGVELAEQTDEENDAIDEIAQINKLTYEEKKAKVLKEKEKYKDKLGEDHQGEPIVVLTFSNYKNKQNFMTKFGLNGDDRFIKGEILQGKIKITSKFE